jgi:hypothetical protein
MQAIAGILMTEIQTRVARRGFGPAVFDFDKDEMNRRLAELPFEPDEKLR